MWDRLDLVRIYTKPKGKQPDYSSPVVLKRARCTVEGELAVAAASQTACASANGPPPPRSRDAPDFCNNIHKYVMSTIYA